MGYGKSHDTMYTGSMYGCGVTVFAVWGYAFSNAVEGSVELNPVMLASTLGGDLAEIEGAIEYLCAADANSRSTKDGGRRLVREGQFLYRVVNHAEYRGLRNDQDRREYFREAKRRSRSKQQDLSPKTLGQTKSNAFVKPSTHTEAETDTETELISKLILVRFEEFWTVYPKRAGSAKKKEAASIYKRIVSPNVARKGEWLEKTIADTIRTGLEKMSLREPEGPWPKKMSGLPRILHEGVALGSSLKPRTTPEGCLQSYCAGLLSEGEITEIAVRGLRESVDRISPRRLHPTTQSQTLLPETPCGTPPGGEGEGAAQTDIFSELDDGARRYHRFCIATGKIGTELVMMARTWLGPNEEGWKNEWTLPTDLLATNNDPNAWLHREAEEAKRRMKRNENR